MNDPTIPALYYLMNFNDFGAGMVTLFHIMVVNNWFVTCNMYCEVMGANWPRIFFIVFWIVTVLIMLNLVISFILEIFADVGQAVEKVHARHDMVLRLRQNFDEYAYIDEIGSEDEGPEGPFNNLTQISVDNVENS